jgi:hypothetical protein
VLSRPERGAVNARLTRIEQALDKRPVVQNHFHLHADGVLAGENLAQWWARMTHIYNDQFESASQLLLQKVNLAGVTGMK